MKNRDEQVKIFEKLEEKGFSLGERIHMRRTFSSIYKDEYPFINDCDKKGYFSTIPEIDSYIFQTKKEVILANAIYEQFGEDFNHNDFLWQFRSILRILGIESDWAK